MAFVQESGNPGLAAATLGAAAGFQKAREIQDQQQAREMAMAELQLRQQQGELQMDMFSEQLRKAKVQEFNQERAYNRSVEVTDRSFNLEMAELERLRGLDNEKRQRMEQLATGRMAIYKAFSNDQAIDDAEMAQIISVADGMDPEAQAEIYSQIAGYQRSQAELTAKRDIELVNVATQVGLEKGILTEDQLLQFAVETQGMGAQAYNQKVMQAVAAGTRKLAAIETREKYKTKTLGQLEVLDIPSADEAQIRWSLYQIDLLAKQDPSDPRIKELEGGIELLKAGKVVQENFKKLQKELNDQSQFSVLNGDYSNQYASEIIKGQSEREAFLTQIYGTSEVAQLELRQRNAMMSRLQKEGNMDMKQDVPLPVDLVPDQQLNGLFKAMQLTEVTVRQLMAADGSELDIETKLAIQEEMNANLARREGVIYGDELKAKFGDYQDGEFVPNLDFIDYVQIDKANQYKAKERVTRDERAKFQRSMQDLSAWEAQKAAAARTKEMEARKTEAQRVRDVNAPIREAGQRQVAQDLQELKWLDSYRAAKTAGEKKALGYPPAGVEQAARDAGWKPKKVFGYPLPGGRVGKEGSVYVGPNGTIIGKLNSISAKRGNKILLDDGWHEIGSDGKLKKVWREQTREEYWAEAGNK